MLLNDFEKAVIAVIIGCVVAFLLACFLKAGVIEKDEPQTSVVVYVEEKSEIRSLVRHEYGIVYLENGQVLSVDGYPLVYPNRIETGDTVTYKSAFDYIVSIRKKR